MSRAAFLQMIDDYAQNDAWPEELEAINALKKHVQRTPHCFDRSTAEGDSVISISVLLVNHDMSAALLGKHKDFSAWIHIGGRMDGEKDAFKTAEREIVEKTGIDNVHFYSNQPIDVATYQTKDPQQTLYDVRFLAVCPQGTREKMSDKFEASRWVTPGEATILSEGDESIQRLMMKWAKAYRQYAGTKIA